MKCGGAKGSFAKPLFEALQAVGYEVIDRSGGGSHFKMRAPGRPQLIVPAKLDGIKIVKRIAKLAGVTLDAR
jgi:hypothetical protein